MRGGLHFPSLNILQYQLAMSQYYVIEKQTKILGLVGL